jgi:hypothetical protein
VKAHQWCWVGARQCTRSGVLVPSLFCCGNCKKIKTPLRSVYLGCDEPRLPDPFFFERSSESEWSPRARAWPGVALLKLGRSQLLRALLHQFE